MKTIERDNKSDIISSLLRTNFDVKDESLDIDLSVCAAIPVSGATGFPLWLNDIEDTADFFKPSTSNMIPVIQGNINGESTSIEHMQIVPKPKFKGKPFVENKESKLQIINNQSKSDILPNVKIKREPAIEGDEQEIISHNQEFSIIALNLSKDSVKKEPTPNTSKCQTGIRRSTLMDCPDCGKSLKLGSMWMHRKIHNSNSKRYNCDICGQKFVQKINLTHHLKLHNAEKPFECPECQKTFPERSHMIRHQKYHSDLRPYKCEKCGKMYKTERCLKVHSLVHLDQRPFVCNVCNKSFLSNSKLKQHSNIHTGERPYKCKYCSRDFTNFPNWLKHTRRRHNVDHKTGEILQKIPSYCSKQKKPKTTETKQLKATNFIPEQNKIIIKKEIPDNISQKIINKKKSIKTELRTEFKNEIKTNMNDLHCLSITSAEELIMEQALEMEEAGFFNNNDNCNGISLSKTNHFLDPENRLFDALYSIDSSPLSSPTSTGDFQPLLLPIPFLSTPTTLPPITTMSSNNFFITTANLASHSNNNITHQILPSMVEAFLGFQKVQSPNM